MFRLISFSPSIGYKAFDYKQDVQFSEAEQIAVETGAIIVCVVDYHNKAILHKCTDFDMHREQIDQLIFDPKVMGLYY
jgi:major membrane immunogen (membrane-anchored lipoprotein)